MSESVFVRRTLFALLVLGGGGVLAIHPMWASSMGLNGWNVSALREQIRATELANQRLQEEGEQTQQRIAIKESVIAELIAGRSTLAEVTEQFLALDASRPAYLDVLRNVHPATTDREVMARNVIAYTLTRVAPNERAAVSSRLEGDLQQMLSGATTH